MKKYLLLTILSLATTLLSLANGAPPAHAATRQATTLQAPAALTMPAEPFRFHPGRRWLVQNQYFHGNSYSHAHLNFRGNNQNNTGNQSYNRGHNLTFVGNAGNLIVNQGRARHQHLNQYYDGNSYDSNSENFIGNNQNNGGNQGHNAGLNEDYSGNAGNQVVN